MIPTFPKFKKLEISDREAVEAFTQSFAPYSDFNFTSLWCWNISERVQVSELNRNLVVRFTDYVTGEPFYSFCGRADTDETASVLIGHARANGHPSILKLVPSEAAATLSDKFCVTEDPDNSDYILSIADMSSFSGNRLRGRRNFVNRFIRHNQAINRDLDMADEADRQQINLLLNRWAENKSLNEEQTHNEFAAIHRFFEFECHSEFITLGIFGTERLIGFSICEILSDGYAMLHFEKADTSRVGVYPYIMRESARRLSEAGCHHINYQQDLGIASLRHAKHSYNPHMFLKKFQVTMDG